MTHFGDLPTAALAAHILELGIPDSPSGMIRNVAPMWPHRAGSRPFASLRRR